MKEKSKKRSILLAVAVLMVSVIATGTALAATPPAVGGADTVVTTPAPQTTEDVASSTEGPEESSETDVNEPAYTGSIALDSQSQDNTAETQDNEAQEDVALASKATITAAQAAEAVKAAFPGATVSDAAIGDENGYLIYEVKVTQTDGTVLEVKVDAGNGTILAQDSAGEDNNGEDNEAEDGADNDNIELQQEGENETED